MGDSTRRDNHCQWREITLEHDRCYSVALDDSGNVYCAGSTSGALGEAHGGGSDAFVMKLNSSGDLQWVTQLGETTTANGGSNSESDSCTSVVLDDFRKYLLCGEYIWSLGRSEWGKQGCLCYET